MRQVLIGCTMLVVVLGVGVGQVDAAIVGYSWEISHGNINIPLVELTNISDEARITEFWMSIGRTDRNYDGVTSGSESGDLVWVLQRPDYNRSGGDRSNWVGYQFSGFDPGETFQFTVDIDLDHSDTDEDYRIVLFNNGGWLNSELQTTFSETSVLSGSLPDYSSPPYIFSQTALAIPEPSTVALLITAAFGLFAYGWRRRKKST